MPDVSGAVAAGRVAAESRMTSRCTIRRLTGATTTAPNGIKTREWASVHTGHPLRLGGTPSGPGGTRTVTVGTTVVEVAVRVAHLPASTSDLRDGDLIEITSGENKGRVLHIIEATWQDQATARRVPVYEVSRPKEWS